MKKMILSLSLIVTCQAIGQVSIEKYFPVEECKKKMEVQKKNVFYLLELGKINDEELKRIKDSKEYEELRLTMENNAMTMTDDITFKLYFSYSEPKKGHFSISTSSKIFVMGNMFGYELCGSPIVVNNSDKRNSTGLANEKLITFKFPGGLSAKIEFNGWIYKRYHSLNDEQLPFNFLGKVSVKSEYGELLGKEVIRLRDKNFASDDLE